MNYRTLFLALFAFAPFFAHAKPPGDSLQVDVQAYLQFEDSVNNALKYQTGKVDLAEAKVTLNVPAGFKFLGLDQSKYILTEIWGNPENASSNVLGMIFPENSGPFGDSSYAFVVTYDELGYVKDHDAGDIDYDEMLKNMQEDEQAENVERVKAGYNEVHIVGWAQKPFYDSKLKILHWAKELKFGNGEGPNTLNYEVRILGRKGVLAFNAVSTMNELPLVNNDISKILDIASFTDGNAYSDFNPDVDQVAAWTIGGLVAGKLLAKAGIMAVILKFLAPLWKFILMALIPIGAFFKKYFGRKKEEPLPVPVETAGDESVEENKVE